MCDLLMLAFWIWAFVLWAESAAHKLRTWLFFVAAMLASACVLAKFNGAFVLVLMVLASLLNHRRLQETFALARTALRGRSAVIRYGGPSLYKTSLFGNTFSFVSHNPERIAGRDFPIRYHEHCFCRRNRGMTRVSIFIYFSSRKKNLTACSH